MLLFEPWDPSIEVMLIVKGSDCFILTSTALLFCLVTGCQCRWTWSAYSTCPACVAECLSFRYCFSPVSVVCRCTAFLFIVAKGEGRGVHAPSPPPPPPPRNFLLFFNSDSRLWLTLCLFLLFFALGHEDQNYNQAILYQVWTLEHSLDICKLKQKTWKSKQWAVLR